MKIDDFEDFCTEVIDKYIMDIEEYQTNINCNCIKVRKTAKHKIFKYYQRKRDEIRENYMMEPTKSLDRHKVATCMMYAILKSKILKVNKYVPHLPDKLLMANEYLAVFVGINIIEQYRKEEGIEEPKNQLIFPITYHETEKEEIAFLNNLCKGLYYLKWKLRFIDIFAYSNIYFFLEKYTDTLLENDSKNDKKET